MLTRICETIPPSGRTEDNDIGNGIGLEKNPNFESQRARRVEFVDIYIMMTELK